MEMIEFRKLTRGMRSKSSAQPCIVSSVAFAVLLAATFLPSVSAVGAPQIDAGVGKKVRPVLAQSRESKPVVGLVLSGGGARGAAHIGVLKVLEENRVPIHCIVGTSSGALVGGGYASGASVDDMVHMVSSINTELLVREKPTRAELSMRRKLDDAYNYVGPELGVTRQGIALTKGAVSGLVFEAKLRELAKAKGSYDFDRLPIPFRAVATDIETGEPVILGSGELPNAMRASMAVPAAIAPAEMGGRKLVDGMLTDNLPVDVARSVCHPDIIIAVNVGTPLAKGDEIGSILGITSQMVNILTEQNVQRSLKLLRPGDILVAPDLNGYATSDFDKLAEIIPRGEAAARSVAPQLAKLALPRSQYAALREQQTRVPQPDTRPVDEIRVAPLSRVNPKTVLALMDARTGLPLDPHILDKDMQRIYGRGDFEHVGYRVVDENGRRVLVVEAKEKSWGPDYLNFGMTLFTAFSGDTIFEILGSYRRTWLDSLGAEWRSDVQIGREMRLFSEFYQPLDPSAWLFVAPSLELRRTPTELYDGDQRVARYQSYVAQGELDAGTQITRWAEARVGVLRGEGYPRLDTGSAQYQPSDRSVPFGGTAVHLVYDQLDSVLLPRDGLAFRADLYNSSHVLGAKHEYTRWDANVLAATAWGDHAVHLALLGGGAIDGSVPAFDMFPLGGFLRLTGLRPYQLYGQEMKFGRVVYMNRLVRETLLQGINLGVSFEAGQVRKPLVPSNSDRIRTSGSLFLAADSLFGPVYLAYGHADGGSNTLYFYLGNPF